MFSWLLWRWRDYWWSRQRKIDLDILWPTIKEQTHGDMAMAHEIFFMHAFNDPAWVVTYGEDLWTEVTKLK